MDRGQCKWEIGYGFISEVETGWYSPPCIQSVYWFQAWACLYLRCGSHSGFAISVCRWDLGCLLELKPWIKGVPAYGFDQLVCKCKWRIHWLWILIPSFRQCVQTWKFRLAPYFISQFFFHLFPLFVFLLNIYFHILSAKKQVCFMYKATLAHKGHILVWNLMTL